MADINSILFLCYPRCGEQDTLAPWEMLKSLAWILQQRGGPELDVALGAFEDHLDVAPNMVHPDEEVTMQMGADIDLEREITPDTRADLLYVPGGMGSGDATKVDRIKDLVRKHHEEGRWVATNCSGIGILHRSGILEKTPVTSAATVSRKLLREGANVRQPRTMWQCEPDDKIFTAAGACSVHPSTIALVWYLFGQELAETMSLLWDTRGPHGKTLFEMEGPDYLTYASAESKLQDDWEDMLLPDPA